MDDSGGRTSPTAPDLGSGVLFDDLRLSMRLASVLDGPVEIAIEGVRLTVARNGLREVVRFLSEQVSTISRERIDGVLAAMDENPRLRPVRWYYASLLRVAGLRDELDISGDLIDGGIEIRARFAQVESGNLLRQLRDRARNLATVTARLHPTAVDGALHVRLDLTPDVNGMLTSLLLNGMGTRPGLSRVDASTIRIDLTEAVAAATADRQARAQLMGRLLEVRIRAEQAVFVFG